MKKDFDIQTLLSKMRLKKLDSSIEDTFHDKLVTYFFKQKSLDSIEFESIRTSKNHSFIYAISSISLLVILILFFIYTNKTQSLITRNTTRELSQPSYQNQNFLKNNTNSTSDEITSYDRKEKKIYSTDPVALIKSVPSISVNLTNEETELAKTIVSKEKLLYKGFKSLEGYFFCHKVDYPFINPFVEYKDVITFWSTDPIIDINGFKYIDSETKYAYIKIQPSEIDPIDSNDKYDVYLIVNLYDQIIAGHDVFKKNN